MCVWKRFRPTDKDRERTRVRVKIIQSLPSKCTHKHLPAYEIFTSSFFLAVLECSEFCFVLFCFLSILLRQDAKRPKSPSHLAYIDWLLTDISQRGVVLLCILSTLFRLLVRRVHGTQFLLMTERLSDPRVSDGASRRSSGSWKSKKTRKVFPTVVAKLTNRPPFDRYESTLKLPIRW